MNALTQHYIRQAALEVQAHNPMANVFVPEEPEWQEVVDAKAMQLLADCSRLDMSRLYAESFEVLMGKRAEILQRASDTWAAINRRWPDAEARRNELAALGAEVLRLVTEELRVVAEYELGKGE